MKIGWIYIGILMVIIGLVISIVSLYFIPVAPYFYMHKTRTPWNPIWPQSSNILDIGMSLGFYVTIWGAIIIITNLILIKYFKQIPTIK
jgi:hypothetical protein